MAGADQLSSAAAPTVAKHPPAHSGHPAQPAAGDGGKQKQAALAAGSLVISKMLTNAQATSLIKKQTNTKIHTEYDQVFHSDNDAGTRFRAALPVVTTFINSALKRASIPVPVSEPELATNFLAEGGDKVLHYNMVSGIDGYQAVGIDTFIDQFAQLKAYLPQDLIDFASQKTNQESNVNELGQKTTTIKNLSVEQALQANASMYAQALAQLTEDLKHLKTPVDIATLPEYGRLFWATLYFNAGFGTGKADLIAKGVDWYKTAWRKGGKNAHLFALERMGSEELLAHDLPGETTAPAKSIAPEPTGAMPS